jgi:hypothetical protein
MPAKPGSLSTEQARALALLNPHRARPKPRSQILHMQASLLEAACDRSVPAHIRAACARSWDVLEERLRIMDGKPLPGQLRPDLEQRKQRRKPQLLSMPEVAPKESLKPEGGGGGVPPGGAAVASGGPN